MSNKFHVNVKDGTFGPCHATKRLCPLGGDSGVENHYGTAAEAATAAETSLAEQHGTLTALKKRNTGRGHPDFGKFDEQVEMDSSFDIDASGTVGESKSHAPEVYVDEEGRLDMSDDWEPISGFSSQDRYSGPLMHSSEAISGSGMEAFIRENPATYAIVNPYNLIDPDDLDTEEENDFFSDNWVLLRKDK